MAQRLPPFSRSGTSGLPTAASPRSSRLPVPSSDTGTASCAGSTAKLPTASSRASTVSSKPPRPRRAVTAPPETSRPSFTSWPENSTSPYPLNVALPTQISEEPLDLYRPSAPRGELDGSRGSGLLSGRGDSNGLPRAFRPLNHAAGRIEGRRLCRPRAGHGGADGHPSARRVAHLHRLACHWDDHGGRLSRQRRSSAGIDGQNPAPRR